MRQPVFAGVLYPKDPMQLRKAVEDAFLSENGPGALPSRRVRKDPVRGVVVPYSALSVSGPCAAWSYRALAESGPFDCCIVVAQGHESGVSMETFASPTGEIRIDQEFVRALVEKGNIALNEKVHASSPAIEVQIPFLNGSFPAVPRIVPVMVNDAVDLNALAVDVKEVLLDQKKKACVIVCAEMTRHGKEFSFLPFDPPVHDQVVEYDAKVLEFLKAADLDGLLEFTGSGPCNVDIISLQFAFLLLRPRRLVVEHYYTSSEVTQDEKSIMGFASVLLY